MFSHFAEFDALLAEVMRDDIHTHDRSHTCASPIPAYPYPFQNNLRYLPPTEREDCLRGLAQAPGTDPTKPLNGS